MALFCCCYRSSEDERQPILQPSQHQMPESARQTRSGTQTLGHSGRLTVRRVCVPELDARFSDVTETFNEQQEHYEVMTQRIRKLRQTYSCNHDNTLSLTECVSRIREEHGRFSITLQMKGYDFSLSVVPLGSKDHKEVPLPSRLLLAQEELRGVSRDAKATVSAGTKLQELIGWLLQSEQRMTEQVKEAAPTYQEQRRLQENLKESLLEVSRAKKLSLEYKKQAGEVLTEVAALAEACP